MNKKLMAAAVGVVALGGVGLGALGVGAAGAGPAQAREVEVWKSPLCGCCGGWVDYMKANGYAVKVHETDDMDTVKKGLGVPEDAWSCHTARLNGYVIEGHVPVEAIDKLLASKAKVTGIASPGMPQGSPGMNGAKEPNVIVTFGGGRIAHFGTY